MKPFRWSPAKNQELKAERGMSFESVVVAVESGGLLDILAHPNPAKYPGQRVLVVACDNYACLVPFVEERDAFFLKTIIRLLPQDHHSERQGDEELLESG